jgi:hypothetical protein
LSLAPLLLTGKSKGHKVSAKGPPMLPADRAYVANLELENRGARR